MFTQEPTYFSELEDQGPDQDWTVEDLLNLAQPEPVSNEVDGRFNDPRLQAIWDASSERERQVLRDVAAGTPIRQASLNAGYSETTARDKLVHQLPRRANLKGYEKKGRNTHCINGHPFSGDNLLVTGGRRVCRACQRERQIRYKERHGL